MSVDSYQIRPATDLPDELTHQLEEAILSWSTADRSAMSTDGNRWVELTEWNGFLVASHDELTWFRHEQQAEQHYFNLLRDYGLTDGDTG